jgi:hypothetical protein
MINLENITLIAITSIDLVKTIKALEYSKRGIKFGSVKIISDIKPDEIPDDITHEYIEKMSNIDEWNYQIFFNMGKYVNTDFAILIHDDGFIVNPDSWKDEFLEYDYVGAPWGIPNNNHTHRDINNNLIRVGNSVSLRSKKLMDLPLKIGIEWKRFDGNFNEDSQICVHNRHTFLQNGIKYADIDVAKYFSHETDIPEQIGIKPFAFHNYGYPGYMNYDYPKFKN